MNKKIFLSYKYVLTDFFKIAEFLALYKLFYF